MLVPLIKSREVVRYKNKLAEIIEDTVIIESPLTIDLSYQCNGKNIHTRFATIMRSPGNDAELAAGLLYSDMVISCFEDIQKIDIADTGDRIHIILAKSGQLHDEQVGRDRLVNSSCGLCSINDRRQIYREGAYLPWSMRKTISTESLKGILHQFNTIDSVFQKTGGNHMVALFDTNEALVCMAEDVGRHNALDKIIGHMLIRSGLPLDNHILLLSSRIAYEMVQKATMAGVGIVVGLGAASDSAIQLAEDTGMTLVGFLQESRFNVYSHPFRLNIDSAAVKA